MIHEPPPFFHRGPSPLARLTFFALLAIATMIADHRFGALEAVRLSLSVLVAPVQQLAAAPGAAMSRVTEYFSSQDRLLRENDELRAKLLDPTTGALVAEDLRTVVLQPVPGEPGVFMTDNRTYSQHANVTLCPDWSGRAIHEQTVTLVLEVTELYVDAAVPVAVTRAIVPTCAAGPTGDECRCQCAAGFELGKCH